MLWLLIIAESFGIFKKTCWSTETPQTSVRFAKTGPVNNPRAASFSGKKHRVEKSKRKCQTFFFFSCHHCNSNSEKEHLLQLTYAEQRVAPPVRREQKLRLRLAPTHTNWTTVCWSPNFCQRIQMMRSELGVNNMEARFCPVLCYGLSPRCCWSNSVEDNISGLSGSIEGSAANHHSFTDDSDQLSVASSHRVQHWCGRGAHLYHRCFDYDCVIVSCQQWQKNPRKYVTFYWISARKKSNNSKNKFGSDRWTTYD